MRLRLTDYFKNNLRKRKEKMGGCGSSFSTKFQLSENIAVGINFDFSNPKDKQVAAKLIEAAGKHDQYDEASQERIREGMKKLERKMHDFNNMQAARLAPNAP